MRRVWWEIGYQTRQWIKTLERYTLLILWVLCILGMGLWLYLFSTGCRFNPRVSPSVEDTAKLTGVDSSYKSDARRIASTDVGDRRTTGDNSPGAAIISGDRNKVTLGNGGIIGKLIPVISNLLGFLQALVVPVGVAYLVKYRWTWLRWAFDTLQGKAKPPVIEPFRRITMPGDSSDKDPPGLRPDQLGAGAGTINAVVTPWVDAGFGYQAYASNQASPPESQEGNEHAGK